MEGEKWRGDLSGIPVQELKAMILDEYLYKSAYERQENFGIKWALREKAIRVYAAELRKRRSN